MSKIVIFDAMSTIRERLESKQSRPGFIFRGVINDALQPGRVNIFAWDGDGAKAVRQKIFPGYKNRPPADRSIYAALKFARELLTYTGATQIRLDGFEGDDLIAAAVERFSGKGLPIEIHTRDVDLVALTRFPNVTCTAQSTIPAAELALYKLCVGDQSDTVPGISGFGRGSWDNADKLVLQTLVNTALNGEEWEDELARKAGFSKASINWLRDYDNVLKLKAMKTVLSPLPMTNEQFQQACLTNFPQPDLLEAKLKEFML